MGYEIYREVLHGAPAELSPAERLVLVVLADLANEKTRECYPGEDTLAHLCGMTPNAVFKALRRLRDRGFEMRVPLGADRNGKPVFAARGHRTTYRIPRFAPRPLPELKGGRAAALYSEKGRTSGTEREDERQLKGGRAAAPIPQEPSKNPHHRRPRVHELLVAAGAADDEIDEILDLIKIKNPGIRDLTKWLTTVAGNGSLAEIIGSFHNERRRSHVARVLAEAARQAPCEDGVPGGTTLHPASGEPICSLCRARAKAGVT